MSFNEKNKRTDAQLAGVCVAVILSVPLAAILTIFLGDDYDTRVVMYGCFLLWTITGAVFLYFITRNSRTKLTLWQICLWFVSIWLWPVPTLVWILRQKK